MFAKSYLVINICDKLRKKRTDYIDWDEYFIALSILSSQRSKDPSTQVGACIVNQENKIVGIGYNGFPKNCSDDILPWSRISESGSILETKYPFGNHSASRVVSFCCSCSYPSLCNRSSLSCRDERNTQ